MEKLRLFESRFEIVPCEAGGYLIALMDNARMWTGKQWAFTNVADLMRFLHQQDPRTNQPVVQQGQMAGYAAPSANDLKQRLLEKHGRQQTPPLALLVPNGDAKAKVWPWR